MPAQKRHKTKYVGVYYIIGKARSSGKPEKIYYVTYRKDGKLISEKAGRQYQDDMTAAKASHVRERRIYGKELTNAEQRESNAVAKRSATERYTIDKLWENYKASKPNLKGWKTGTYQSQYNKHLKPFFADKEPQEILPLDVKRVEITMLKTHSSQMVKHILKLLRVLCNFGADNGLCLNLSFKIKMPTVDNDKTEDLNPKQLGRLLEVIRGDTHRQAGPMMLMALYSGMRRGEMFRLQWNDVDFERGFIHIRDPKGGLSQKIPLNEPLRNLFLNQDRRHGSPYVFPGRGGGLRTNINKAVNQIKKKANLPKDFRPLHGLRHVYASMLASSGKVDMYTLQKLLTHKDPKMTQRYAHLRDETLRKASDLAGNIIASISKNSLESEDGKAKTGK